MRSAYFCLHLLEQDPSQAKSAKTFSETLLTQQYSSQHIDHYGLEPKVSTFGLSNEFDCQINFDELKLGKRPVQSESMKIFIEDRRTALNIFVNRQANFHRPPEMVSGKSVNEKFSLKTSQFLQKRFI